MWMAEFLQKAESSNYLFPSVSFSFLSPCASVFFFKLSIGLISLSSEKSRNSCSSRRATRVVVFSRITKADCSTCKWVWGTGKWKRKYICLELQWIAFNWFLFWLEDILHTVKEISEAFRNYDFFFPLSRHMKANTLSKLWVSPMVFFIEDFLHTERMKLRIKKFASEFLTDIIKCSFW